MLLFTLLPVVATVIGVFFSTCSPPGLKSAFIPVVLMLAPPVIVHYNRDIILQWEWEFEEVEEKEWTGTRALSLLSPPELEIWEEPPCVYSPAEDMVEVLSGESASEDMVEVLYGDMAEDLYEELAFEDIEVRGTAYTPTISMTTPTKASAMLTITLTTTLTTRVTVNTSTTTIMAITAAPPPTYTRKLIVPPAARSLIVIFREYFGRWFGTTVIRIPLLWCIRAIFWMIPLLLLNSIDAAGEYLIAWLRNRPHRYSHRSTHGVDPLVALQALYTFATFLYSWKLTMDFTRRGGDVVIFEAFMPYLIEAAKLVFWAYNLVEYCFFCQGMALGMLSYFSPWAFAYCPPDWALMAKAHFDMDPGQTIFSQVSLTFSLAIGYSSYLSFVVGGLDKSPAYGWSWKWQPGYKGAWLLGWVKLISFMVLTTTILNKSANLDKRRMRVRTGYGGGLPDLIPTRSWVSFVAYCAKVLFSMIDRHKVISRAWVSLSGTLARPSKKLMLFVARPRKNVRGRPVGGVTSSSPEVWAF